MTKCKVMCALLVAMTLAIITPSAQAQTGSHKVTLVWIASPDAAANPSLTYNVYRMSAPCPPDGSWPTANVTVTKIGSAIATPGFVDTAVVLGQMYCYATTSQLGTTESVVSNTSAAVIPLAPPTGLAASGK